MTNSYVVQLIAADGALSSMRAPKPRIRPAAPSSIQMVRSAPTMPRRRRHPRCCIDRVRIPSGPPARTAVTRCAEPSDDGGTDVIRDRWPPVAEGPPPLPPAVPERPLAACAACSAAAAAAAAGTDPCALEVAAILEPSWWWRPYVCSLPAPRPMKTHEREHVVRPIYSRWRATTHTLSWQRPAAWSGQPRSRLPTLQKPDACPSVVRARFPFSHISRAGERASDGVAGGATRTELAPPS